MVKAPTLVLDDGEVLMDSTLIIDYLETLAGPAKSLMPSEPRQRLRALRLIGLALAASEKSVQLYYERNLRPADIQYAPWVERVEGQLSAAYAALEGELEKQPLRTDGSIDQDGITLAVAWSFTRLVCRTRWMPVSIHGSRSSPRMPKGLRCLSAHRLNNPVIKNAARNKCSGRRFFATA